MKLYSTGVNLKASSDLAGNFFSRGMFPLRNVFKSHRAAFQIFIAKSSCTQNLMQNLLRPSPFKTGLTTVPLCSLQTEKNPDS